MTWEPRHAQLSQVDHDTPRSRPSRPPQRAPQPTTQPLTTPTPALDDVPYVELHLHSCFSMLDGASSLEELATTAKKFGYEALALTDHDGLYGAMEFAQTMKRIGLRPITGAELTIASGDGPDAPRSHLTLLVETRAGYRNLCRLISAAYGLALDDPEQKQARRRDPWLPRAALQAHAEGLIVLSGCRESTVATNVLKRPREAEASLRELVAWFGRDQVFVELQDNLVYDDAPRNRALVTLAARLGLEVVGTGNVHYHERARHRLQDVLVAIRHRQTLDESHRQRRPNDEFFLRAPQEQARRFAAYHPEAARNSVRIAQRCRFDITEDLGYRLPTPPLSPGQTPIGELRQICEQRLGERYPTPAEHQRAVARLEEELRLIDKHRLAGFFLIYHEVFELATEVAAEVRGASWARSATNLPVGRGRGSSVASIVCYLIGLSHIDPLRNNLFLGRFLNEEMPSLPDIDLDFPRDIRERLIERVHQRWGRDHAALVASFPTYRMRSAVRDIGKALGLPIAELSRVARLAGPYQSARDLRQQFLSQPEFAARVDAPVWRDLIELAPQLARFPRHLSEHVGGMVIASDPLIDCVPCQPAAWEGRYLCQWDKDSVDDARMVKIDFLSLGMLSAVEESIDLIAQHHGHAPDLSRIDFQDPAVYDDICAGDTVGVFQVESRAQIAMLPRTQPRTLDDLAVQVAIVRPGPIVGGAVNPYVRCREQQRADPHYQPRMPHPCLQPILAETLGVVIYQEQVLQVAEAMGGFSAGEADRFRRDMSRKDSPALLEAYRTRFLNGAAERGVSPGTASRVFDNLKGFAEFGFPKSHATAFALLAYQTAWLKRYHPAEFFCGLFNSQPMGFYPPHVLTNDAQRHDVIVRRPEINLSHTICTIEDGGEPHGAIRLGLGYVRRVGAAAGAAIEQERERAGPFRSLFDFVQRTGLAQPVTVNLIQVGAFDAFGLNRRELIWQLGLFGAGRDRTPARLPRRQKSQPPRQRQLHMPLPTAQDHVALPDFSAYQRMAADYELLGLSPDAHPIAFLRPALGEGVVSSRQLRSLPPRTSVTLAGLVVCRQRPLTAKGIVFLLLEDEYGMVNVLVGRQLDAQHPAAVRTAMFVTVRGTLEKRAGEQRTIVASAIEEFVPAEALRLPSGKSWA